MSPGRYLVPVVLLAIVSASGWLGWRAQEANRAYVAAVAHIDSLRVLTRSDPSALSSGRLAQAKTELHDLRLELNRIDEAMTIPIGEPILAHLPWVGPRYVAARDVLRIGLLAMDVGTALAQVDEDIQQTLGGGGLSKPLSGGPSWLAALKADEAQLTSAADAIESIQTIRSGMDDSVLPARVRVRLTEIDAALDQPQVKALRALDFAALFNALGGPAPSRYLLVFQNPAELRPTGGFPGTMALVTLNQGELGDYQFFDAHELTDAYVSHRQTVLPQPWPIERYFPQNGFLLHDALWWPDFPRSAGQLMTMYSETGWPPIDGVIAVQPEAASTLLDVTGPFTVDFQGQQRRIAPDNAYSEIERLRLRDLTTQQTLAHKQMLGLIGKNLIERLKTADHHVLLEALKRLGDACQRRDVQVYAADATVEAELDRQHCTGRLLPTPGQPTLAVTYANVALAKTSLDMRPLLELTSTGVSGGERQMHLEVLLRDGAVADEDPTYRGFQRWWVEVTLPEGSTLLSDGGSAEDPDAPNGGSYVADLFPDMTGHIKVRFSMPDTPSLLIRRQPGVRVGDLIVGQTGCRPAVATELSSDVIVNLATLCD